MPQLITSVLLDGPPVTWQVKEGRDTTGEPFVIAETSDAAIGFTARNINAVKFFAASLLAALRQYEAIAEITERDPIGL